MTTCESERVCAAEISQSQRPLWGARMLEATPRFVPESPLGAPRGCFDEQAGPHESGVGVDPSASHASCRLDFVQHARPRQSLVRAVAGSRSTAERKSVKMSGTRWRRPRNGAPRPAATARRRHAPVKPFRPMGPAGQAGCRSGEEAGPHWQRVQRVRNPCALAHRAWPRDVDLFECNVHYL